MTDLIPHPGDDLVPDGWWQRTVVPWADEQTAVDDLAAAAAQIAGFVLAYKRLGADTLELTKAHRYLELRLGELLGDVSPGQRTDLEPSRASEGLSKDDRLRFRQLAAGRDQVLHLLEEADDPEKISRAACLRLSRPAAPSAREARGAIAFDDDDEDDIVETPAPTVSWTSSHERQRKRILDLLDSAMTQLVNASEERYTPATRAGMLRDAENKARRASGLLGELAFGFER